MAERDDPPRGEQPSHADRTLLGVAPPKLDSSGDSPLRSPVFVRAGTSVADSEPLPVPRMALPSRPPPRAPELVSQGASLSPPEGPQRGIGAWLAALGKLEVHFAGVRAALWMVLVPTLLAAAALMLLLVNVLGSAAKPGERAALASSGTPAVASARPTAPAPEKSRLVGLADLESKPLDTLSASDILKLAEGRSERQRDAAKALRQKLEDNPALAKDKAVQGELLHLVEGAETARDALAALAQLEPPLGADLLYEVWTGTTARTDATDLARALVYSTDVRPKASPALGVALDLRSAQSCEQYKAILPKALKDGDRRSLHLLTKLAGKRGCGPKKTEDCYACLREQADELTATINAVKSRRPPSYTAP